MAVFYDKKKESQFRLAISLMNEIFIAYKYWGRKKLQKGQCPLKNFSSG
jgi:hypothetical protein